YNDGTTMKCSAAGSAEGMEDVGGLIGYNYKSEIANCYATSSVDGDFHIGGLTGYNFKGTITNSYAAGNVTGFDHVGGLIGREYSGLYTKSFWDMDVNPALVGIGNTADPNVIGETTANMQILGTFLNAGWDFTDETANGTNDIWRMCVDGVKYPMLSWQFLKGDLVCPDGVDMLDLAFWDNWLEYNCEDTNYCNRADLDKSGHVDLFDYSMLAENWMKGVIQ
ncbi:MAG: hypothetical protein GY869_17940, partial [Planctomycetes bacterium]|nr:hypothetical protein [Planctomycetota bacterium]